MSILTTDDDDDDKMMVMTMPMSVVLFICSNYMRHKISE
jgi:hypothetical protein